MWRYLSKSPRLRHATDRDRITWAWRTSNPSGTWLAQEGTTPVITGKTAERWKSWQDEMREELVTVRYDVKEDVAAKEHIAVRISVAVREYVEFR